MIKNAQKKPAKAWFIDSAKQDIFKVTFETMKDMQALLGGYIGLARRFANGDVMYVDDEGMLKEQSHFFMITGLDQPLCGNGLVVGREVETEDSYYNQDVGMPLNILKRNVKFLSKMDIRKWMLDHGNKPAISVNFGDTELTLKRYEEMPAFKP